MWIKPGLLRQIMLLLFFFLADCKAIPASGLMMSVRSPHFCLSVCHPHLDESLCLSFGIGFAIRPYRLHGFLVRSFVHLLVDIFVRFALYWSRRLVDGTSLISISYRVYLTYVHGWINIYVPNLTTGTFIVCIVLYFLYVSAWFLSVHDTWRHWTLSFI